MNKQEIISICKKVEENYIVANQLMIEGNKLLNQEVSFSDKEVELLTNDVDIDEMVKKLEDLRNKLRDRIREM